MSVVVQLYLKSRSKVYSVSIFPLFTFFLLTLLGIVHVSISGLPVALEG